jgi:hypothetical protein
VVGGWGPKRLCAFINNFNPTLTKTVRANHDSKLIMSGGETNVLTWYITTYASKKQQRSSNVSALLAKRVAFHTVEENRRTDLANINKRLIQRCANTLARDREFSGPEIMSYLMGWGDRFESHVYVAISADGIMAALKDQYPGLRAPTLSRQHAETAEPTSTEGHDDRHQIITMVSGVITLKDHLNEYAFRGKELREMNLLTFMLDTYDTKGEVGEPRSTGQAETDINNQPRLGRRPNQRVAYREGFSRQGHCRVYRTAGHETLPHFMGGWFPRNDNTRDRELYCASMLALLKPWENLANLKTDTETFGHVFDIFISTASRRTLDIVENIEYYYECYDGAKKRQEMKESGTEVEIKFEFEDESRREDVTTDAMAFQPEILEVTDEDIDMVYENRAAMRERLHADVALNTALNHGVFPEAAPDTVFLPPVEKAR